MLLSLLDTDILSEVLKQKDARVVRKASDYLHEHQRFAFCAMTRYEIVRGLKAKTALVQLKRFQTFCQQSIVLPITDDVLDRAADLWSTGYTNGHPHRDADLIIAATALEHGRALVTGNSNDFEWIPGLTMENWRRP